MLRPRRRLDGFTLLELIVVITIIGILSTIVVVRVAGMPERARSTKIQADLQAILQAANMMYVMTGKYPETIRDMLRAKDAEGRSIGGLDGELPRDPWGNEYVFSVVDGEPQVICLGSDGTEGGEGEARDVTKPQPE